MEDRPRGLNHSRFTYALPPVLLLILLAGSVGCFSLPKRSNAGLVASAPRTMRPGDAEIYPQEARARSSMREPAAIDRKQLESEMQLMWPIAKRRISRGFKSEEEPGRPHDGVDIPAPKGTRVYSPAEGRVLYAGHKFRGYGRMILIEHEDGIATIYGHLQKLLVKPGELVRRGSLLGLVGRTGRTSGAHLHFEVRKNRVPVDPLEFLP